MRKENMTIELFQQLLTKGEAKERPLLTVLRSLTQLQSKADISVVDGPQLGAWSGWDN